MMELELNTIVILIGLVVNGVSIISHFIRLERRFTKIETFLKYKFGFDEASKNES